MPLISPQRTWLRQVPQQAAAAPVSPGSLGIQGQMGPKICSILNRWSPTNLSATIVPSYRNQRNTSQSEDVPPNFQNVQLALPRSRAGLRALATGANC